MEKHFMVDIETTGVQRGQDEILQIAAVEIEFKEYWHPTGRVFNQFVHSTKQPHSEFAKKHMGPIYKAANETSPDQDITFVGMDFRAFIHFFPRAVTPKYFMGWNASNFDLPFLFDYKVMTPSYYELNPETGKEELKGDAHYRVYEQTGFLQGVADITGLSRNTLITLAKDLNPTGQDLPPGKSHDALYDCYQQIIMQNGLIKIGRMALRK